MNKPIPRIGYACQNLDIHPNQFKTCRLDRLSEPLLIDLIQHNLKVLDAMLDYNIAHQNQMMRISSSLIPFASSPKNTFDWSAHFSEEFKELKLKIVAHDIRISFHPGQYTVLNALDDQVVENSLRELAYHHTLLELLSGRQNDKMILHIGGIYGNKVAAIERFITTYQTHENLLRKHLIIENDDRLYTIEDALYISSRTGLPVVFDNLHHQINPSLAHLSVSEILAQVSDTWTSQDGQPKMHYSQQAHNKRPGAHTNTIDLDIFHQDYLRDYARFGFDIMLEVKDKNRSFLKVHSYFHPSRNDFETAWAHYKYWALARSHKNYLTIRNLLKRNDISPIEFYQIIDQSITSPLNINQSTNALEHIWGYFKNIASNQEKVKFFHLLNDFKSQLISEQKLITYLYQLSLKYNVTYLKESYYLNPHSSPLVQFSQEVTDVSSH